MPESRAAQSSRREEPHATAPNTMEVRNRPCRGGGQLQAQSSSSSREEPHAAAPNTMDVRKRPCRGGGAASGPEQ